MRFLTPSILLFVALLLAPIAARAEEGETEKVAVDATGWGRFGVGTMIHHRKTTEMAMPGMAPRKTVRETRKTLVRITDTDYVVKVEQGSEGNWKTTEEKIAKTFDPGTLAGMLPLASGQAMKREALGKESVTVDGTAYECEKVKVTMKAGAFGGLPGGRMPGRGMPGRGKPGGAAGPTTTIWEHAEHGVLKMTSSGAWGMDMEVTKLDTPVKVGDVTLRCKASTMTMSQSGTTIKRLESADVPEDLVRSETTVKQGPMENRTVEELIGFVKKAR